MSFANKGKGIIATQELTRLLGTERGKRFLGDKDQITKFAEAQGLEGASADQAMKNIADQAAKEANKEAAMLQGTTAAVTLTNYKEGVEETTEKAARDVTKSVAEPIEGTAFGTTAALSLEDEADDLVKVLDDVPEVADGITDAIDNMDDLTDSAEGWLDLANDVGDVADEITDVADATGDVAQGMGTATVAAGGFSAALKGIGSFLKTWGVALAGIAAIAGLAIWAQWMDKDYERKADAFTEKKSEYENNLQQVEEYNTKIQDLSTQIDELNSKDKLTFTEQSELENLKAQKEELEQLRDIQESLLDDQKRETAEAAMTALEAPEATTNLASKYMASTGMNGLKEHYKKSDLVTAQQEEAQALIEGQQKLQQYRDDLEKATNETDRKSAEARIKEQEETNKSLKTSLGDRISTLQEYQKALKDSTDPEEIKKLTAINTALQNTTVAMSDSKSPMDIMRRNIESAFTSTDEEANKSLQNIKSYLIDAANQGIDASDALAQIGLTVQDINLADIADGAGGTISAVESLNQYFNDLKSTADETANSIKKVFEVDGSFEGVKAAQESENAGANWESMAGWLKNGKDLYEKGLVGTDDFQTLAQFMSPKQIKVTEGFNSDAYVKAWEKAQDKINRYFDSENPFESMDNFIQDATSKGKDSIMHWVDEDSGELANDFKTTAEAADKMGLSVEATETILNRLKDYGFEFEGVEWSGQKLDEYRQNLENIQQLYDQMEPGAEKDRLGFLLKGFNSEYENFQNDLSELNDEAIIQLKFEYDLSQVLQDIQDLQSKILNDPENGFKKYAADYIMNLEKARELMEERTGIDENSENAKDYAKSYDAINEINKNLQTETDEGQRESLLKTKTAIEEVQNAYQQALLSGEQVDWSTFLTGNMDDLLNNIPGMTEDLKTQIQDTLNGTKGQNGGTTPKSENVSNVLVGKDLAHQAEYYKNHKDEMSESERKTYQNQFLDKAKKEGYKNAGLNDRDNLADDVEASNKRIAESSSKAVDEYLKLNEAKRKGSAQDKELLKLAKQEGISKDKLINKYGKNTKAVEEYNKKRADENTIKQAEIHDRTLDQPSTPGGKKIQVGQPTDKQPKPETQSKSQTITPTVDVSKAQEQMNELTSGSEAKDIVVNLVGNDEATPMINAWNQLEADEKFATLSGQDQATAIITLWNTLSAVPKFTELSAEDQASTVVEAWNSLTPEQKMAIVKGNNTDALAKIKSVAEKKISDKSFSIVANGAGAAKSAISSIVSALGKLKDKTVNLVTKKTTVYSTKGAINSKHGELHGTAHASGTAYAKGSSPSWISGLPDKSLKHTPIDTDNYPSNWQTKKNEAPLVGEVGPEMVVNGNRWWLVGENGPEFTHIPAHSVVFNSKQTDELLNSGSTSKRGKANLHGSSFAHGNVNEDYDYDYDLYYDDEEDDEDFAAFMGGTAYVDKSGGRWKKKSSSSSGSKSKKSSSSKSSKKKSGSGSSGSKKKKSSSSNSALDGFKKWLSQLFDWIEVRLDRLKDQTEKWSTAAEKAVNVGSTEQTNFYKNAISSVGQEIEANTQADKKYSSFAHNVGYKEAAKAKLSKGNKKKQRSWVDSIYKQLQTGALFDKNGKFKASAIKRYSENQLNIIKDMQSWYDKSQQSAKAVRDLTDSMQDLYDKLEDLPNLKADEAVERLNKQLDHLKNQGDLGFNYKNSSYSNSLTNLQAQTDNAMSQWNERKAAAKTTSTELANAQAAAKKLGANGKDKIEINDKWSIENKKAAARYNAALQANTTAQDNLLTAEDQYWSTFYENAAKKLENITNWYESISSVYENHSKNIDAFVELGKETGQLYTGSSQIFKDQRTDKQNIASTAAKNVSDYQAQMIKQIWSGEIKLGSKRYNDALAELNSLREAEYNATKDLKEFENSLIELDFTNLQNSLERIKDTIDRLKSRNDYVETVGNKKQTKYRTTEASYAEVINNDIKAIDQAYSVYNAALAQQKEQDIGSEKWLEWNARVKSARDEVVSLATDIEDMADKIREVRWKSFEDGLKHLEDVTDQIETIQNLLNEDNFLDKKGLFTTEGLTNISLYGQLINNANGQIYSLRKALVKVQEEYDNNIISQDELNEKIADYEGQINSLASSVKDYRNNILESYIQSLERQNELFKEQIELQRSNLDRLKQYRDYEKSTREESKNIAYLENQVRALAGSTSKADIARLASLQDQLAQARSDAADSRYDHEMEVRQSGYDKLAEDADKSLERITDLIQRDTTVQNQLISDMLAKTQDNYTSVYGVINQTISDYGLQMSKVTTEVLKDLDNLGQKYGDVSNKVAAFADAIGQTNPDAIKTTKITSVNTGTTATDTKIATVLEKDISNIGVSEAEVAERERKAEAEKKAKEEAEAAARAKAAADAAAKKKAEEEAAAKKKAEDAATAKAAQKQKDIQNMQDKINKEKAEAETWLKKYRESKDKATKYKNAIKAYDTAYKKAKKAADKTKIQKQLVAADKNYAKWNNNMAKYNVEYTHHNNLVKEYQAQLKAIQARQYAKGSKYIREDQMAWTQEQGSELIYRKSDGAMLTPLGKGDKVFTADMTDNLWTMAKMFSKDAIKQNVTDVSKVTNINNKPTINMNFDSFMNVEGNVDENVVNDIRSLKDEFYTDFTKRFTEDFSMLGNKFRF